MKPLRLITWLLILTLLPALLAWVARKELPASLAPVLPLADPMALQQRSFDDYRREMQAALQGTEWVDRENGLVRVPIEVAMGMLLKQGLPVREAAESEPENR